MKKLIVALIFFLNINNNVLYSQQFGLLNVNEDLLKSGSYLQQYKSEIPGFIINDVNGKKVYLKSDNNFKNRISGGAGFAPRYENLWTVYLEYLRYIKNKFYLSSSANLYELTLILAASGHYNILPANDRTELLIGAGINIGTYSDDGIKVNPQVSMKFDIHLNKFNTIGAEIRFPFTLIRKDFFKTPVFIGNVGLNF
ncbi:MAG: hypothetical protein ABIY50_01515 [Ignavibacteria bacterium]